MHDNASQVHIAGPTVTVSNVRRQRCLWCGALIDEIDLGNISRPLEPGEDPATPEPWEPGSWTPLELVRLSGTFPRVGTALANEPHADRPDSFAIPDDSCMALDHAVTT